MNTLQEAAANLHTVTLYSWQQYGWHERERELMLFQDDMEKDVRTITKIRFTRFSIRISKTRLTKYNEQRKCWTDHHGESEPVQLPNRKGEKALLELIRKDCRKMTGTENPTKVFTWSPYYEAEALKLRADLTRIYGFA